MTIEWPGGTKTLHMNQRLQPPIDELFCPLGQFDLDAGSDVVVRVTTEGTDGYVSADAVQAVIH